MALSVVKYPQTFKKQPGAALEGVVSGSTITYTAHGLLTNSVIYGSLGDDGVWQRGSINSGFWYVTKLTNDTFQIMETIGGTAKTFPVAGESFYWNTISEIEWSAVHLPIVYKLKSDLWPTNSVDTARTVSSYANDLGYVKLTLSGTHNTTELEFVKVTFTGGTTEVYQVLTWYSTTVITINLPYRAGITFVSVQKYYADYHARIKVYAGLPAANIFDDYNPLEEVCEIKAVPDSDGLITVNINEFIKSKIGILKNLPYYTADFNAWCSFYISYAEAYTYSTGGYTLLDYVGSYTSNEGTYTGYAIDASLPFKNVYSGAMSDYVHISAFIDSPAKFLTPSVEPVLFATQSNTLGPVSQYFDISFIRKTTNSTRIKREVYNGSNQILNVFYDTIPAYGLGVYRHQVERSSYLEDRIDLTVQTDDGAGYYNSSETKTIYVNDDCGPSSIDFGWKNYLGGWDYWRFTGFSDYGVDVEETRETDKNIFPTWPNSYGEYADTIRGETARKSRQTIKVFAENLTEAQVQDLFRIRTSPLVQIINSIDDRRTVIPDSSSFQYYKQGEKNYSITFTVKYTDLMPSQSL